MKLVELLARFTQALPLADGIFTGLYYCCPRDPRRKRAHAVFFEPLINPYSVDVVQRESIERYLNQNDHYRMSPKWGRIAGDTIGSLSLAPSIGRPCCHITITNGDVYESPP